MRNLIVLKLGGSVITDKKVPYSYREAEVRRLGEELASNWPKPLIVVHGGGSFGHGVAAEYSVREGYRETRQVKGFIKTVAAMRELNGKVVSSLTESGLPAIGMSSSSVFITNSGRIATCALDAVLSALDIGLVPVLNGDAVFDRTLKFTILSGDQIAIYLAERLNAQRLIFAIDVDGVYASNAQTGSRILMPELSEKTHKTIRYADSHDVTGGLAAKIEEAFRALESGVEVIVLNGLAKGRMEAAISGQKTTGTRLIRGS